MDNDTVWTDDMMQRFRALHANGENSFETIAAILRAEFKVVLTKNACIGKGRRMGLKQRRKSYWPVNPTISKPRAAAKPKPRPRPRKTYPNPPQEKIPPVLPGWEVVLPATTGRLAIHQLERDDCRYPFGDRAPYTFCGATTVNHASWCAEHARLVFNKWP